MGPQPAICYQRQKNQRVDQTGIAANGTIQTSEAESVDDRWQHHAQNAKNSRALAIQPYQYIVGPRSRTGGT